MAEHGTRPRLNRYLVNLVQIIGCIALVAVLFCGTLWVTEPHDRPFSNPLDQWQRERALKERLQAEKNMLARLAGDEARLRLKLQSGDWQSHYEVARARYYYVRELLMQTTRSWPGKLPADPELHRLVALMRQYARNQTERENTEQLARGKLPIPQGMR